MESNIAMPERIIRIIIGLAILYVAFMQLMMVSGLLKYFLVLVGLVLIATGAIGTCPMYSILKSRSAQKAK